MRKEKVSSSHHPLACKMGCRRWRGPCTQECSSSKMHFALYEANEENSDALIKTVDILVRSFVRHPSFFFCQHLQRQNDTYNYNAFWPFKHTFLSVKAENVSKIASISNVSQTYKNMICVFFDFFQSIFRVVSHNQNEVNRFLDVYALISNKICLIFLNFEPKYLNCF